MDDREPDFEMRDLFQEIGRRLNLSGDLSPDDDGVYTTKEISEAYGISISKARNIMREVGVEVQYKWIDYGLGPACVKAYRIKS